MITNILDLLTVATFWFLAAIWLLILHLSARRRRNHHLRDTPKITLLIFILFAVTMFVNTLYLSIPLTSKVGMLQSDRIHILPPDIYLQYPSAARPGDNLEIALEALNANFLTTIKASLVDSETGKTIDEGSITVDRGGSETKIFTVIMPEKDFKITINAVHPDTLSDLRTTITITKAGIDIVTLLLIGVVVATPLLASAAMERKRNTTRGR